MTDNQAVSRLPGEIVCQSSKGLSCQGWPHGWSCFEKEFEQEICLGPFKPQFRSVQWKQNVFSWVLKFFMTWPCRSFPEWLFCSPKQNCENQEWNAAQSQFYWQAAKLMESLELRASSPLCSLGAHAQHDYAGWQSSITLADLGRKAPLNLPSHNAAKVQSKFTCGSFFDHLK